MNHRESNWLDSWRVATNNDDLNRPHHRRDKDEWIAAVESELTRDGKKHESHKRECDAEPHGPSNAVADEESEQRYEDNVETRNECTVGCGRIAEPILLEECAHGHDHTGDHAALEGVSADRAHILRRPADDVEQRQEQDRAQREANSGESERPNMICTKDLRDKPRSPNRCSEKQESVSHSSRHAH